MIYLYLSSTLDILIHDKKNIFFPQIFFGWLRSKLIFKAIIEQGYQLNLYTTQLAESINHTISTVNNTEFSDMCNSKGLYWRHVKQNFSNIYLKQT